jgi:tryptophan synthase beta subunit
MKESNFWYILKIKEKNILSYFIYNHNNYININYFNCLFKDVFDLNNNIHKNISVYFGCQSKKIFNEELEKYNNYKIKYYIKKEDWKHIYTHIQNKKIELINYSNLINT